MPNSVAPDELASESILFAYPGSAGPGLSEFYYQNGCKTILEKKMGNSVAKK